MVRKVLDAQPATPGLAVSCLLPAGHFLFPVHHGDAVGPLAAGHVVNGLGAISVVYHIHWLYQAWPQPQRQSLSQSPEPSAPLPGRDSAMHPAPTPGLHLILPSSAHPRNGPAPCDTRNYSGCQLGPWPFVPAATSVQCLFYLHLVPLPEAPLSTSGAPAPASWARPLLSSPNP